MTQNDVRQIKVGQHKIGFVGLERVFETLAKDYTDAPDDVAAKELLTQISKKNYIPDSAREKHGQAFVREFRKFLGQPFKAAESSIGLEIKVLGAGCNICDGIENDLMEILAEMGIEADLEHVREADQIAQYKVSGTPALVINNKVVCVGSAPSKAQIQKWLGISGQAPNKVTRKEKSVFIKNISFSEPHDLAALVGYEEGRVVSRTFAQNSSLSLTLFAFYAGEGVSTHTAPGDAMLQVLDGEAAVIIDGNKMTVTTGQVVVMPANVPHSVTALKPFKMLLTVVK
jgi:quercetin dioxygenase-like cupin family protein